MNARRESWARVAAGSAGNHAFQAPTRSGAFSHLGLSRSIPDSTSTGTATGTGTGTRHTRSARSVDADSHHHHHHHHAMATSWARNATLPPHPSQSAPPDHTLPLFFVPSYLKGSKYAEKLEDALKAKLAEHHREAASAQLSNPGLLSTSASSINLHKAAGASSLPSSSSSSSHRGLTHEVIERTPALLLDPISPWPTRWNDADKFAQLEIENGGRLAKFAGTQKTPDEAAAVRTDFPMPRECGIYYYEVTIISKGKDGRMIGLGFSGPKVVLSRIPGWEPDSYAYHGDDGQVFSNTTSGKAYGPKFGTLDVVGCGINFRTNTAFFTKNGHMLGIAFRDLKPNMQYFPTVGMKKPNETVRANFGQEPFAFDIDKMIQDEKAAILAEISRTKPISHLATDETELIHQLVAQYLAHDGYVDTGRAFADEIISETRALASDGEADIPYLAAVEDSDDIHRQKIRKAILEGDIDKALKHTSAYYPSVLRDNENIYFKLRCRKFIEMIRRCNELNPQYQHTTTQLSARTTGSTPNKRNSTATDEYDFEMELDEQLGVQHPTSSWDDKDQDQDHLGHEDSEDNAREKEAQYLQLTEETIKYGMELKHEFTNDPRREIKRALEDTFALIGYENPRESSLAPLLEVAGRVPVAEELNSAILVSLGKSSSAALELLLQQTEALVASLAEDGGPGAFVNVRRDFLT